MPAWLRSLVNPAGWGRTVRGVTPDDQQPRKKPAGQKSALDSITASAKLTGSLSAQKQLTDSLGTQTGVNFVPGSSA